jgi:hypothetical protein
MVQNVCRNSLYLLANKLLLQKLISVFTDMSLCLLWLFMSPWMNEYFSLWSTSLKVAKKAETCRTTTCLYVIVINYSAVVGIYTVTIKIQLDQTQ